MTARCYESWRILEYGLRGNAIYPKQKKATKYEVKDPNGRRNKYFAHLEAGIKAAEVTEISAL